MHDHRRPLARPLLGFAALAAAAVLAGCSSGSSGGTSAGASTASSPAPVTSQATSSAASSPTSTATMQVAYLSFAVANSYDAPMLAAAQAAAAGNNIKLTVFDANNDPKAQFTQLQNVISSGKYQGVIVQPIFGTGLTDLVKQAIAKNIKVVNIDQVLGPDLTTANSQVDGMSGNVIFVPTDLGTKFGKLTVDACAAKNLNPCKVGYLYDIKASSLDVAIRKSFDAAIAGSPVKVVAEGQDFFTPAGGLKATQDMLTAHPDLSLVAASDQGIEGAIQAVTLAKKNGKVLLVGYGGSAAGLNGVKAGTWYGTIIQAPATEGQQGTTTLAKALRENVDSPGVNVLADLPDGGVVTKANVGQFTAEWPG